MIRVASLQGSIRSGGREATRQARVVCTKPSGGRQPRHSWALDDFKYTSEWVCMGELFSTLLSDSTSLPPTEQIESLE